MKITNNPFKVIDWDKISETEHSAETGYSLWKTFESGNVRARIVVHTADFMADHYCEKGHIIFVLEGKLNIRLKDGSEYKISKGMSVIMEDSVSNPHLAYTEVKTTLFINSSYSICSKMFTHQPNPQTSGVRREKEL